MLLLLLLVVPCHRMLAIVQLSIVVVATLSVMLHVTVTAAAIPTPKLKVFILAGQSNMVGFGSIQHLDVILQSDDRSVDNDTSISEKMRNEIRASVWNDTTDSYVIRSDVYIRSNANASGTTGTSSHGYLTVNRTSGFAHRNHFGPEVLFGYTIGDAILSSMNRTTSSSSDTTGSTNKRPNVLLIKTAYSGQSLAVDFRSPSAVITNDRGIDTSRYGKTYRLMIAEINDALVNMGEYVPNYNASIGYELSGFVWFQGYKDSTNIDSVNEYESNLGHFIRDVRKELNAVHLPFVIGELGMHGRNVSIYDSGEADLVVKMRQAQSNVCNLVEFKNNTRFVPTAQYSVQLPSSNNSTSISGYMDTSIKTYNNLKHYYGRADTIFYIGRALGRGMIPLIGLTDDSTDSNDLPTISPATMIAVTTTFADIIQQFWKFFLLLLNIY